MHIKLRASPASRNAATRPQASTPKGRRVTAGTPPLRRGTRVYFVGFCRGVVSYNQGAWRWP